MSLSRPTASSIARKFAATAGVVAGLLGFAAIPALAAPVPPAAPVVATVATPEAIAPVKAAPAKVSAELAVCPGQTFSQPFEALKDSNYYTLVEGSEFNGPEEGWELNNGAQIVEGTRPDGSTGGVLELPSGSYAVSPPVCVTLQYPTARGYIEAVQGGGGVTVGVYYAGSKPAGQPVGQLNAKVGKGWELSAPFNVKPQLGGSQEGVREVRFIYANTTRSSDFHVSGLYVDPRMS
ncbi:MAG TPA: hypothetical protein VHT25_02140 [Solirubrobacteraceae bacterium]|nr:hypothetical protein [Solirubrobacteraceae bacterium]